MPFTGESVVPQLVKLWVFWRIPGRDSSRDLAQDKSVSQMGSGFLQTVLAFLVVMRIITHYNQIMIINFRHKGLQQYYEEGNSSKLPAQYLRKINRLFDQLDAITAVSDIQQMGSGIHKLTGDFADFWAVTVTPNYRIIFRFEGGDIYDVDYVDYH